MKNFSVDSVFCRAIFATFWLYTTSSVAALNGVIHHPMAGQTYTNNLIISVQAQGTVDIDKLDVRFMPKDQRLTLCQSNCDSEFKGFRTNISPFNLGLAPGPIKMELLGTTQNQENQTLGEVEFFWSPNEIEQVELFRQENQVQVSWAKLPGYLRYNLYAATEPGITPNNILEMENGVVFRSLKENRVTVTGLPDDAGLFVIVTGVDGSGESAFSSEIPVPALNNTDPIAEPDEFFMEEDQELTANVLENDIDPDNQFLTEPQELTVQLLQGPESGELTLESDGSFIYQPVANFHGTDLFTYEVTDQLNGFASATVSLQITAVNDLPSIEPEDYQVLEDNTLIVDATAGVISNDTDIDNDPLSVMPELKQAPAFGSLLMNPEGSFEYTPNPDFFGEDSFVYFVTDGNDLPAEQQPFARVTISVEPVNDAPFGRG